VEPKGRSHFSKRGTIPYIRGEGGVSNAPKCKRRALPSPSLGGVPYVGEKGKGSRDTAWSLGPWYQNFSKGKMIWKKVSSSLGKGRYPYVRRVRFWGNLGVRLSILCLGKVKWVQDCLASPQELSSKPLASEGTGHYP